MGVSKLAHRKNKLCLDVSGHAHRKDSVRPGILQLKSDWCLLLLHNVLPKGREKKREKWLCQKPVF